MRQETLAPENVLRAYLAVLSDAILSVRMRIRYGETIDMKEIHDLMDGIENIPEMLCAYGNWHVEENIDWGLNQYDERWYDPQATPPKRSLVQSLKNAREQIGKMSQPPSAGDVATRAAPEKYR